MLREGGRGCCLPVPAGIEQAEHRKGQQLRGGARGRDLGQFDCRKDAGEASRDQSSGWGAGLSLAVGRAAEQLRLHWLCEQLDGHHREGHHPRANDQRRHCRKQAKGIGNKRVRGAVQASDTPPAQELEETVFGDCYEAALECGASRILLCAIHQHPVEGVLCLLNTSSCRCKLSIYGRQFAKECERTNNKRTPKEQ